AQETPAARRARRRGPAARCGGRSGCPAATAVTPNEAAAPPRTGASRSGAGAAASEDGGDRVGDVADVALVDPGDVHAARLDHVDVELLAEPHDLLLRQPEEREHPALLRHEREVHRRLALRELVD